MSYKNFCLPDGINVKITRTKKTYDRKLGEPWSDEPTAILTEEITKKFYENCVTSIDFMNGFCGGTCRAEKGYTPVGRVPVKITLVNPDRTRKHVETYKIERMDERRYKP